MAKSLTAITAVRCTGFHMELDLLSTKGIRTTWGAPPYTNQVFDEDATIIKRMRGAGAVLVAKTTLGELAMGETWFGGMTRNPWNLKQGSSGSSAGSAAATAAGLLPMAIGTETLGSIVSPSDRCGVTGLRPSYGRVSRTGAMTLSWSMDKIGRFVERWKIARWSSMRSTGPMAETKPCMMCHSIMIRISS